MTRIAAAVIGAASLAVLTFLMLLGFPWGASDVVPGASPSTIKALRLSMTPEEIRALVGTPCSIEPEGSGSELWHLSKPVPHVRTFPSVFLRVSDGSLEGVYVEKKVFWGVDEEPLYLLSRAGMFEAPEFIAERWTHAGK